MAAGKRYVNLLRTLPNPGPYPGSKTGKRIRSGGDHQVL